MENSKIEAKALGWPVYLAMATLVTAEVVGSFEVSMIYAAMATLYQVFNDPVGVGWLLTAFLLVSAAAAAICSRLGDLFGRKRVLIIMLLISGTGSLISALSDTLGGVIFGRAIQGAYAAIMPLCFGIAREILPKKTVPIGIGVLTAGASVSAGLGLILGGAIVDNLSWRWIFIVPAAMSVVVAGLVVWLVPLTKRSKPPEHLDFLGGILFVPAVATILFAVTKAKDWGWDSWQTLGAIIFGLLMLGAWVWHERRQSDPLIDVRQFANRHMALTLVGMSLFGLGASQAMLLLLLLLQQPVATGVGLGISATLAALVKLPSNVLAMFGGPWSGVVAARHGARRSMIYGSTMIALGWVAMTWYHGSIWFLTLMIIVSSFGGAIAYSALANLVIEVAPAERTSEATGLAMVVRTTFTAVGAQMVAFLLASDTIYHSASEGFYPSAGAYSLAFTIISSITVVGFFVALALPQRSRQSAAATNAPSAVGVKPSGR